VYGAGIAAIRVFLDGEPRCACAAPTFYAAAGAAGAVTAVTLGAPTTSTATSLGAFALATSTTPTSLTSLEIAVLGPRVAWKSVVASTTHTNAVVQSCALSALSGTATIVCEATAVAAAGATLGFELVGPDDGRVRVECVVPRARVLHVTEPRWELVTLGALGRTCVVRKTFAFGTAEYASDVRAATGMAASAALEAYVESEHAVAAVESECAYVVRVAGRPMYTFTKKLRCGYDPSAAKAGTVTATHGMRWPLMVGADLYATWPIVWPGTGAPAWSLKPNSVTQADGFVVNTAVALTSALTLHIRPTSVPTFTAQTPRVVAARATLVGPDGTEFGVAMEVEQAHVGLVPWHGEYRVVTPAFARAGERAEVAIEFDRRSAVSECTCVFAFTKWPHSNETTVRGDASTAAFRAGFMPAFAGSYVVTMAMSLPRLSLTFTTSCLLPVRRMGGVRFRYEKGKGITVAQSGTQSVRAAASVPSDWHAMYTLLEDGVNGPNLTLTVNVDGKLLPPPGVDKALVDVYVGTGDPSIHYVSGAVYILGDEQTTIGEKVPGVSTTTNSTIVYKVSSNGASASLSVNGNARACLPTTSNSDGAVSVAFHAAVLDATFEW
jgi:hypothetical protein